MCLLTKTLIIFLIATDLQGTVIQIFGTSCAGKSTLSKSLHERLGSLWILIDRDTFEDDQADEAIFKAVHEHSHLIIDTQLPYPFADISILVYAPIEVLISRDEIRNQRITRSEKRKFYARAYIYSTFADLYSFEGTDCVSILNPQSDALPFCITDAALSLFSLNEPKQIYSKYPFDILIKNDEVLPDFSLHH